MSGTPVTVWESLQTQGTPVANGIIFIDDETLQPDIDVAGISYDKDTQELRIRKLALEILLAGATGNITLNASLVQVRFAAAAQSLVLTDDRIEADSLLICTVATDDATSKSAIGVVIAAGSATIKLNAAATAETRVNVLVLRAK